MTRQFAVAACILVLAAVGLVSSLSVPEAQPATATTPSVPASDPTGADEATNAVHADVRIVVIDVESLDEYGATHANPYAIPTDQMYRRFPEPRQNLFPEPPPDWRELIPGSL